MAIKVSKKARYISQKIGNKAWLHTNGRTFMHAKKHHGTPRRSDTAGVQSGQLHAPMPGKIIDVSAKEKMAVQTGDVLCVLEAMKMEYQITAPFAGTVSQVLCKNGDQVELNTLLIEVLP